MPYVKKGFGPALQRNYDKIIFAFAILILAVSGVLLFLHRDSIANEQEDFIHSVDSLRPDHAELAPVDTEPIKKAGLFFSTPFAMGTNKVFLVAQERVRCINPKCRRPIPYDAEVCGFCGDAQPTEGAVTGGDSDGDGLPDEFEEKYAFLNPVDATDADADYDGDGFSNLEEFEAGTDPSASASHPSKIQFLRVKGVEEDTIAYRLMARTTLGPGKYKYQIKAPSRDFNVNLNEEFEDARVPGGKFKIVATGVTTNMVIDRAYGDKPRAKEFPVVGIINGHGLKYRLVGDGTPGSSGEFRVTFICTKDAAEKEYLGLPGQPFPFDGEEFTVFKVDRNLKSVLIRRVSDKKEFAVPKL